MMTHSGARVARIEAWTETAAPDACDACVVIVISLCIAVPVLIVIVGVPVVDPMEPACTFVKETTTNNNRSKY